MNRISPDEAEKTALKEKWPFQEAGEKGVFLGAKELDPCLKHAGIRAGAGRHKMYKRQQKMTKKVLYKYINMAVYSLVV